VPLREVRLLPRRWRRKLYPDSNASQQGTTQYGFRWGPLEVMRLAEFPRAKDKTCYVLGIRTDAGTYIDVYVSDTGRSIRVYSDSHEWQPVEIVHPKVLPDDGSSGSAPA
jgi:hypothetical protein